MTDLLNKAQQIKLVIFDVDGTLTNGILYYGAQKVEMRAFHIHDGLGIKLLQKAGISVAVISAKPSDIIKKRLQDLAVEHIYLGQEDKRPAYKDLKTKLALNDHEIAYMGDDLPDLPLLKRVGFSATVPDAPQVIQEVVDYTTKKTGGNGAVRELSEYILNAQCKLDSVIESYLAFKQAE